MEEIQTVDTVGPIVATADSSEPGIAAHAALESTMSLLESRIKELEAAVHNLQSVRAQADAPSAPGRKTISAAQGSLLAKGGTAHPEGASIDDALRSLSVEQRIAVKSGLMRAGLMRQGTAS